MKKNSYVLLLLENNTIFVVLTILLIKKKTLLSLNGLKIVKMQQVQSLNIIQNDTKLI